MTDPDLQSDLPNPLREALRGLGDSPRVPPEVDRRILAEARAGFARRQRFRRAVTWGIGAAVAASVAVLVWVRVSDVSSVNQPQAPIAIAEDIDGSGRVDILDAYVVARRLDRNEAADPKWDLNRDGKVDAADVDTIASAAVRLTPAQGTLQ